MPNIVKLTGVEVGHVADLHGNSYPFNGCLDERILSRVQTQLFSFELKFATLNDMLLELGWLPGAMITLVRSTHSVYDDEPRLKWNLGESWVATIPSKGANHLRPLLSLMFPLSADILRDLSHESSQLDRRHRR